MDDITFQQMVRWLFTETWWSWDRPPEGRFEFNDVACHYFNLLEAIAWFTFSVLVLRRWCRFRRSWMEIAYATAFVTFGLSDLVEAWKLTSWLLWWKLINLTLLFSLRSIVIRRYYPGSRIF